MKPTMLYLIFIALVLYWVSDWQPVHIQQADPIVQIEYCPMWKIWHRDREAGIPVEERFGWPDSGRRYYSECKDSGGGS